MKQKIMQKNGERGNTILSAIFIVILVILLFNVINSFVQDFDKFTTGPAYGWTVTMKVKIATGIFCTYLGILMIWAFIYPSFCGLFEFLISTGKTKQYEKHPAILICGIISFVLGITSFLPF